MKKVAQGLHLNNPWAAFGFTLILDLWINGKVLCIDYFDLLKTQRPSCDKPYISGLIQGRAVH